MKLILFLIISLFRIGPEVRADDHFESDAKAIEKAHENISTVRMNFKKTLRQAIKDKGIPGAMGECQIKAPSLGKISEKIEVGRTSQKLRNKKNQPRFWVKPLLDEYQKLPPTQQAKYKLVHLGPHHYGYVEPIYVEAVCLNCHGTALKPEVKKEIKELYPQDQATDFQLGDFRGLIWLESRNQ